MALNPSSQETSKDNFSGRSGAPSSGASERVSQARSQTSDLTNRATDMASEFYSEANSWLSSNYGKVVSAVAAASAIGAFGYFLGRRNARNDF